ncbi:hypothetical protein [Neobacillus sp. DY30]|uniref:hypothetical protein n=1 Tax=Neobacillus sp. DY30 TaxID=3047871 RepID=UPI0024C09316|nr:hypothetical protein [Neobacillus sp. DY30]WHY00225.1 hypothetical protein QNH29_27465 [Neobacillus sp. DY30]
MKIIVITLAMLAILIGFSFGIDLMLGFDMKTAWRNAISPFRVMEVPEYFVFVTLIVVYLLKKLYELTSKWISSKLRKILE